MKYRYKHWLDNEWKTTSSLTVIGKTVAKLGRGVNEVLEIRRECPHKNTWNDDGIKTCHLCGEQLEVTSYRD